MNEVLISRPGQVAALNAGLKAISSDVTAITDDDAAPHRNWLALLLAHFLDPTVAGVGGRDLVQGSVRSPREIVGIVGAYGRVIGNHHRGAGPARRVDVLKGSNMAFRTTRLREFGFDERLRGAGAQVHNDMTISLRIRAVGGILIYDPAVLVDHHVAPRIAGDDRMAHRFSAVRDEAHNETLALLDYLPDDRRLPFLFWTLLCGTRRNPGTVMLVALLPVQRREAITMFAGSSAGRLLGVRAWTAARVRARRSQGRSPVVSSRAVHVPSLKNIRGVVTELGLGLMELTSWRSRIRWAADIFLQRLPTALQGPGRSRVRTIRLRDGVTLCYRLNRGDLQSLREVWLDRAYRFPVALGNANTVVDLGANIGLTSVYLARRHHAHFIVAIEPVAANAALARRNLALNGIKAEVIEAVVGPQEGVAYFRDAQASNVGHLADDGRQVAALNITTILSRVPTATVDLVKIDIEGAEDKLLSGDCSWLRRVSALMIEFHTGMVDHKRLIAILNAEGFQEVRSGQRYGRSATSFLRVRTP
jgi:FkbM family methyltransferase